VGGATFGADFRSEDWEVAPHTPSQDPVYLLFWVLTAVTTPHWVLVPNAVRYWSIGTLSIFPTILRNRVLDCTRIATCCRVTAPAMPQEGGGLSFQRPLPLRSEPTRHVFLAAAGSMELRSSTTQKTLHCHRAAGTVVATRTILRNLHEQRLFTIKNDCSTTLIGSNRLGCYLEHLLCPQLPLTLNLLPRLLKNWHRGLFGL